ncbi:MAG: lipocalin family protein [Candidatus Cryptobacteroides sp.]
MKKLSELLALSLIALSCSCTRDFSKNLVGIWTETIPGQEGRQGVEFLKGGAARSVNTATLEFKSWKVEKDALILQGTGIGNRQSCDFSDTLRIVKADKDSLVLEKGKLRIKYSRGQ